MVKCHATSSSTTLAPLFRDPSNLFKRDQIRLDLGRTEYYGSWKNTLRRLRTPKGATFFLEDLVILLLLQEVDKDLSKLKAAQRSLYSLTAEQEAGIARQLFENCSTEWTDEDWCAASKYLHKLLNEGIWDILEQARKRWDHEDPKPAAASARQQALHQSTDRGTGVATSGSNQAGPLAAAQEIGEAATGGEAVAQNPSDIPPLNSNGPSGEGGSDIASPCADAPLDRSKHCGKCKMYMKSSHLCDMCGMPNHPWCGIPIGDEGHSQQIRCLTCQPPGGLEVGASALVAQVQGSGDTDVPMGGDALALLQEPQLEGESANSLVDLLQEHLEGGHDTAQPGSDDGGNASERQLAPPAVGAARAPAGVAMGRLAVPLLQSVPVTGAAAASGAGTSLAPGSMVEQMPGIPVERLVPPREQGSAEEDDGGMLDGSTGNEAADSGGVTGRGRNPNSLSNLQSHKRCRKCNHLHGNKKGSGQNTSRCGQPVAVKNADGTLKTDEHGNIIKEPCDFVFVSATQRDIRKLQREAMLADDARMPDPKKLKYSAVEKASVSLIKKVTTEAKALGLDAYVAVLAPSYFTSASKTVKAIDKQVEKVSQTYDGAAIASTMFRHATGPLTRRLFEHASIINALDKIGLNTIQDMVKKEEQRRLDEVVAGSSATLGDLEGFLIKLGLSTHLAALKDAGYDLDTLVKGSDPSATHAITAEILQRDTSVPIGCCRKIMQHAEALLNKSV